MYVCMYMYVCVCVYIYIKESIKETSRNNK